MSRLFELVAAAITSQLSQQLRVPQKLSGPPSRFRA